MNRRDFLKSISAACITLSSGSNSVFASQSTPTNRLFITLQAEGAWDVTGFCDPKINVNGAKEITTWSRTQSIQKAGNISYAPIANNHYFFNKYAHYMMVINGIDAQTNSHSTGILHNWSGHNNNGYPSLSSLFAAQHAPELPLSYLNFGGYGETANLIRYTRLNNTNNLYKILKPNATARESTLSYRNAESLKQIKEAQQARLERLRNQNNLLPSHKNALETYYHARNNSITLSDFADHIPTNEQIIQPVQVNREISSDLLANIQITLIAMSQGMTSSADLVLKGFDTHADHDLLHPPLIGHLTDSIDYLWTYAETLGIADRITLYISSDFSRTPHYNSANGKDHWPIGSGILMEKNPIWGNVTIGRTDEFLNAKAINPITLEANEANGVIITPKHIHSALRDYLGLSTDSINAMFPINSPEKLNLLNQTS